MQPAAGYWQRWISQPQTVWLRKATFQLHLWSGIGLGLYVFLVSFTGSILVFRNELYRAFTLPPIVVTGAGERLTDAQLRDAAAREYPDYTIQNINRARNPDQAVTISLKHGGTTKNRLLNPYTGADLGDSVPRGIWAVSKLMELHDDLFAGKTGRKVNGFGGVLVLAIALTGMVVWWPGIRTWRRGLTIHRNVGWQRLTWDLHKMVGFWSLAFVLVFALSGAYLGNPEWFQDLADRIQPPVDGSTTERLVDKIIYWLAYLHFGRINGIAIPCSKLGFCDTTTKSIWALFGLAPAGLFVTGTIMWWNRVVRKKLKQF